jgi:hypothetical protein
MDPEDPPDTIAWFAVIAASSLPGLCTETDFKLKALKFQDLRQKQ